MRYSALLRSAQTIKPHVPMIKFRKGVHDKPVSSIPTVSKGTSSPSPIGESISITEHQLPRRFRRQVIADNEIILINSGGAL